MTRQPRQDEAFTLVEALIVIAIIGLLAMTLRPSTSGKTRAQWVICKNNLKQIGEAAKEEWDGPGLFSAIYAPPEPKPYLPNKSDLKANPPDSGYTYQYFGVLSNHLASPRVLICPADERREHTNFNMLKDNKAAGAYLNNTKVSYFVGRDADFPLPQMIRSGDRNIGPDESGTNYGYSMPPDVGTGGYAELGTNNTSVGWTRKMHKKQGNVLFVDGHVEQLTANKLRMALKATGDPNGTATKGNLILFP